MKTTILSLAVLLLLSVAPLRAQEYQGAALDLRVGNGVDRTSWLFLGVREGCSSGLDMAYEEYELPPTPPNEIFDARVVSTPGKSQLGTGSYRDYRAVASSTEPFTETYTIAWQCGEGSNGVIVEFSDPFPARIASVKIDGEDMAGKTSWTSIFLQGQATVEVRFIYAPVTFSAMPSSITFAANNKDPLPFVDVQLTCEGDPGAPWAVLHDAPSWLYVTPSNGSGSGGFRVSVISSSQPVGSYQTTLQVRSPLYNAALDIPVTMSMTVGVDDPPAAADLHLAANYPNPFTGQTLLRFRLGNGPAARPTLRIHDALGRVVADLSASIQDIPVLQSVVFDARLLPAGVYTCRLRRGDELRSMQMLLLK